MALMLDNILNRMTNRTKKNISTQKITHKVIQKSIHNMMLNKKWNSLPMKNNKKCQFKNQNLPKSNKNRSKKHKKIQAIL